VKHPTKAARHHSKVEAAMSSASSTDYSDLLQDAPPAKKVRALMESLRAYVDIPSIPVKDGYSKVECLYDESEVLVNIREEFKKEPAQSKKITDIVKSIVPRPEKRYYISLGVRLLVFQGGWSNLIELVGENNRDDCIVLIPIVIDGSAEATVHEPTTKRQSTFTFKTDSEFIIAGRCSIWVQAQSKVVCVVLCIGRDKE